MDNEQPKHPYSGLNQKVLKISFSDKIPEVYRRHNPNRLYRKGDIVEIDTHGRNIAASLKKAGVALGKRYTVTEDESDTGHVSFAGDDCNVYHSMFFWLKLITPVEELEPYFIEESHDGATIVLTVRSIPNGEGIAFRYCPGWGGNVFHSEEQFRQHAEAERDCLNAEHRKEMEK